jgi:hypothetical protein
VKVRSEELSVCLGSYLGNARGDACVDASGKQACLEDTSANVRAATRVKPEQAPIELTWMSSRPYNGEDQRCIVRRTESAMRIHRGIWAQHAQKRQDATREICRGAPGRGNSSIRSWPRQKSEEPIVVMKPGNAGGAKGLWFGVCLNKLNERGSA